MVSVSAPRPVTVLPSSSSRTVTLAWASVPSVTAWTWNSCRRPRAGTSCWIALKIASTGPSPWPRPSGARRRPPARARPSALPVEPRCDVQLHEADLLVGGWISSSTSAIDVLVEDVLLLVGQVLEAHERIFERVVAQLVAQLLQLVAEGVAAGMLAHDQVRADQADVLGPHDLVGLRHSSACRPGGCRLRARRRSRRRWPCWAGRGSR